MQDSRIDLYIKAMIEDVANEDQELLELFTDI